MDLPTFEEVLQETINKYNDKHGSSFTIETIPEHMRERFYTEWRAVRDDLEY